jgi:peptidoglycan/LPS O-acetylase OafA/YrhL
MIVYATSSTRISQLRSIFDHPLAVYLGKISYSLYLVHGPIVHMLGVWLVPWLWTITGSETMLGKETGFAIAFIVMTALVVWTADTFCWLVDERSVKFAKWLERLAME